MKKLFKFLPIALLGFCLVFNSCSQADENDAVNASESIRFSESQNFKTVSGKSYNFDFYSLSSGESVKLTNNHTDVTLKSGSNSGLEILKTDDGIQFMNRGNLTEPVTFYDTNGVVLGSIMPGSGAEIQEKGWPILVLIAALCCLEVEYEWSTVNGHRVKVKVDCCISIEL